jgi:hypothetical protein
MGMATAALDHVRDAVSSRAAESPLDPQIH